jgi:hypothetical protein
MANPPTFFFSYARQDNEGPGAYVSQFFKDLEITLAQYAGVSLKDRKLGTFDLQVIKLSQNWREVLSERAASDNSLVAVVTPLYVNRSECGREMAMFLLRSRKLGIDQNGRLTGVENVVLIRWLPENAYSVNGRKNIPEFLGLIQDIPPDDGNDEARTKAIEKYQRKGMQGCVSPNDQGYIDLLNLIVTRIREMEDLPPTGQLTLENAPNAFAEDWRARLAAASGHVRLAPPVAGAVEVAPRPLASIVAFYITQRRFTADVTPVPFADGLIAEAAADGSKPIDTALAGLLADIRAAAGAEGFSVFHAVSNPLVPADERPLLQKLAALSADGVQTFLIVDPAVWPGVGGIAGRQPPDAVTRIIQSPDWTGGVLLPAFGNITINVTEMSAAMNLPPRLEWLPDLSDVRVSMLRRIFVDTRGRLLQTVFAAAPNPALVPTLKSVTREKV